MDPLEQAAHLREARSKLEEAQALMEGIAPTPASQESNKEIGAYYMVEHAIELVRTELVAIEGEQ
jgi:hypothetical protein